MRIGTADQSEGSLVLVSENEGSTLALTDANIEYSFRFCKTVILLFLNH